MQVFLRAIFQWSQGNMDFSCTWENSYSFGSALSHFIFIVQYHTKQNGSLCFLTREPKIVPERPALTSTHVACNMYAVRTYFFRLCWFTHFYRHGMIPAICSVNSLTLPNIIGVLLKNINVLPTFKNMPSKHCFLICPSSGFGKHG